MKTRALTWTTPLALLMLLTGCGIGTEVGNGFKPKKKKDAEGANKQSSEAPDADEGGSMDPETGSGNGDGDTDGIAGAPTVNADFINATIPKALLFATCGTPFADGLLELPFELVLTETEALVWNVAGAGSSVTLRGDTEEDAWDIDRAVPDALVIKDENGVEFSDTYKCLAAVDRKETQQADETFIEAATVAIDHDGSTYTVSWATSYETKGGPRRLKTISIQAPDASLNVELEARY